METIKKGLSISRKLQILIVVLVLISAIAIGLISFLMFRNDSIKLNAERAQAVADAVASMIDSDKYEASMNGGVEDEYYKSVVEYLDSLKQKTGVLFSYVMDNEHSDIVTYYAEGWIEGQSDRCVIGDQEEIINFSPAMLDAINTGERQTTSIYDSGEYGMLVSGFCPIKNSAGQVIAVAGADISMQEALAASTQFGIWIIILVIAFPVLFWIISLFMIKRMIGRPIKALTLASKNIAEGNMEVDLQVKSRDELGMLTYTFNEMVNSTQAQIETLELLADGDLTPIVKPRSDKDSMSFAMQRMIENLSEMFGEINSSTEMVSSGAKQIAEGASILAQGSVEQSSVVEQLSNAIGDVAAKTKNNAEMAEKAAELAETIKGNAEKGSEQMERMMQAVNDINEASVSISKVMKVIDDIAFQTNILALNAAVEAARAGQHGKGFAVVAEEVRNLAAKSAEAAKDTGNMIADSMDKAELGVQIANDTAASLTDIVTGINESNKIVNDIAKSSEEQSIAITKINDGIDSVAQVVQQNSATAEESAAASEEMNSQSNVLQELVMRFKLNTSDRLENKRTLPSPKSTHEEPSRFNDDGFGKY